MANRYYDSLNVEREIKPGKISAELREALNLPENDLPIWIYRMRALGYPPGWLKKAIVDTDDIFETDDTESKKRKSPSHDEVQYDHSKLIVYPGFNAPMPKNCIDYHYYVNMPAMLEHQQLEYAKQRMNAFKPAQIPKRIRTSGMSANGSDNSLNETKNTDKSTVSVESAESPDSSYSNKSTTNNEGDKSLDKSVAEDEAGKSVDNVDEDDNNKTINKSILNNSLTESIKLVSKGSPMPKNVERAPLEKFSEGVVGELLYFENTPMSSGKFDAIRGLLNTIRKSKSDTSLDLSQSSI